MATKNSTIWTPANVVTCVRIALVPIWLVIAEVTCGNHDALRGHDHAQA